MKFDRFYFSIILAILVGGEISFAEQAPTTSPATRPGHVSPGPASVGETKPATPLIKEAATFLKSSKEGVSEQVIILANEIDALFGNTRALNEYYDSTLTVTQKSYLNTLGSGSYDIQSNLNLSLPNLRYAEERIRRWWSGVVTEDENKVSRKEFKELNPWEYNQGVGLRFSRPLAYNLVARANKNFITGIFLNHFMEQISWDSVLLWQESSVLLTDYALTHKLLFRFLNQVDWGMSSNTQATYHGPTFIYNIDKISATSFDARVITGGQYAQLATQNYTAGITYRTSLHPIDWFYLALTPELSWPRTNDFKSVWTIYVTLDIVFGRKR